MKKIGIFLLLLSIIISGTLTLIPILNANENYVSIVPEFTHSFTKAICNENNFCQDYETLCNGKDVISLSPTGFAVQFSSDWEDLRNEEDREIRC